MLVFPFLMAWVFRSPLVSTSQTYFVEANFCHVTRPYFREDTFLSWRVFQCADVHAAIRRSLDVWQYNSLLSFREVVNRTRADIIIGVGHITTDGTVAIATTHANHASEIRMNSKSCWYTDRAFCASVTTNLTLLYILLGIPWICSILLVVQTLLSPVTPFRSVSRLVSWSVLIAVPMVYIGAMLPCLYCYDFTTVMMHEIGHVLGFAHSSVIPQQCGCGTNVSTCMTTTGTGSIMHESTQHRHNACLSQDDVDGLRSMYGQDCGDPILCYNISSFVGYSRISVALVYAFTIASVVVGIRNGVERYRRQRRHVLTTGIGHTATVGRPVRSSGTAKRSRRTDRV